MSVDKQMNSQDKVNPSLHSSRPVADLDGAEIMPVVEVKSEPQLSPAEQVGMRSIWACIFSTFLIRIASRGSFVILGFYLGEHFDSATVVAIVIEAFYVSELLMAPVVGVWSDQRGRKPFMLWAPVVGAIAAFVLMMAAFLFPTPKPDVFDLELVALLLVILAGRLLEGAATALNAPANLGYITDATVGNEKLRVRVMTGYQVATVAGIALGIPFGGYIWQGLHLGRLGFLVVIGVYALCYLLIFFFMRESLQRTHSAENHGTWAESRAVLREKRIFTFVPAWLAAMALLGAWIGLILIVLTYPAKNTIDLKTDEFKQYYGDATLKSPVFSGDTVVVDAVKNGQVVASFQNRTNENGIIIVSVYKDGKLQNTIDTNKVDADKHFPNQLLYGGFDKQIASLLVGGYGILFIAGMGIWTVLYSRFRRTTIMLIGTVGTLIASGALTVVNAVGGNPGTITSDSYPILGLMLIIAIFGVLVQSGFTPAALTHLAAISETLPGKRGAVMGLYSVLLGVGQLVGTWLGGVVVDLGGFYGLMIYSVILTLISASSVWYMRSHNHDIDDHLVKA